MRYVPLLAVPLLLYNAFAFLIFGDYASDFREAYMFRLPMPSGATFELTVATTIVILALLLLGVELVKAARIGAGSIVDHALATVLLLVFVVEFLLVEQAATGTFLILTTIALVDLICGFAVSIRTASRDITVAGPMPEP